MKRMTKEDREFLKEVEKQTGPKKLTKEERIIYSNLCDMRIKEQKKEKLLTVIFGLVILGLVIGIAMKFM